MEDEKKSNYQKSFLEKLAFKTIRHIGSIPSLIIHTIFFVGIFALERFGFDFDKIMLILTTAVSLEAIYLSIFIQMTVNHQARQLAEVSEDIDDIQEDMEEISDDVEEISKDIDDIQEEEKLRLKHQNEQEKIQHIEIILKDLLQEVRELKDR